MNKRINSFLMVLMLLFTAINIGVSAESAQKWTEALMPDGWIKVTQDGGSTLGYSPDSGVTILTVDGFAFKDLNQNGVLDPYEDWRLDADTRAENATSLLETEQMIGFLQMGNDSMGGEAELNDNVKLSLEQGIRSFGHSPSNTIKVRVAFNNALQAYAEGLTIGIPVDRQGEPDLDGTSAWPSNLAMASTFNPEIAWQYAVTRAQEYRAMGVTSGNFPQVDLTTDPRWQRTSGTFGEDPALNRDMVNAYVNGLQSTYAADGTDLGWGVDSFITYVKHFPGDGNGESGRESHHFSGQYTVEPGGQRLSDLLPFYTAFNLDGLTKSSGGVMTSYSIGLDQDGNGLGGQRVGSTYDSYVVDYLLRDLLGFEGVVVTDYGVISSFAPWGVENLTEPERLLMMIENPGNDKAGNYRNYENVVAAVDMYREKYGEVELRKRLTLTAVRAIRNMIHLGLFENPYLTASESIEKFATPEQKAAGLNAQMSSVIMLKNNDNLIKQAGAEKLTVYIPYRYVPESFNTWTKQTIPGYWDFPTNIVLAEKYFNVVTDTVSDMLTGPVDANGNPTISDNDLTRATAEDLADIDFALVMVDYPTNLPDGMGKGYDATKSEYIPISLQYRPYTADSEYVRQVSISGTLLENGELENRSYYGKDAIVTNESDLNLMLEISSMVDNVVVVIKGKTPFIAEEFESAVDSILVRFNGVGDEAVFEVVSGKFEPYGLLPMQMPANMDTVEAQFEDVPRDMECYVDSNGNTYDFTFGMNWSGVINDERVQKYNVAPLVYEDWKP